MPPIFLVTSCGVNIGLPISLGPLKSSTIGIAKALPVARVVKIAKMRIVINRF
jgi:hypothetical protein